MYLPNKVTLVSIIAIYFNTSILFAQETLNLDAAIQQALEKNFYLKIAQADTKIADNNNTKENAGYAPTLTLTAGETPSVGFTNQRLSNGTELNRLNISNNVNTSLQLQYTLFDGGRRQVVFERLGALSALTRLQFNQRAELVVYDVSRLYTNVVRQQDLVRAFAEQLDLYTERLNLAKIRLEVGKGNALDMLQAETDLNVQKLQLERQKQAVAVAKMQLYQAMNIDVQQINFNIVDTLTFGQPDTAVFFQNMLEKNKQIQVLMQQHKILTFNQKEADLLLKPRINLVPAASFSRNDNTAGLFLTNQNAGINAGISLVYPLYDGHNARRQQQNARLEIEKNSFLQAQTNLELKAALYIAYQNYQNAVAILRGEEENKKIAFQAIDIAMERFRLGRSTVLELKQIQKNYEDAMLRTVNSKYEAKMAELEMMRLAGFLFKGE